MIENNIVLSPEDQKAIDILNVFLPDKIFDMHMHIGSHEVCPGMWANNSIFAQCGDENTMDSYIRDNGRFFGNRKIRANMIVCPDATMCDPSNGHRDAGTRLLVRELDAHPECVGEIMVSAKDTAEELEAMLIHPRIRGFKCYHVTSGKANSFQCRIGEFLPESAWEVANKCGLCITLHMVRDLALADPENISYICQMAEKYPNAKLILAHAGRGFATWTVMDTVEHLVPYKNIYFDLSAVCESGPFFEIIRKCGHKRVFWGSDYPVSMFRGKCISIGPSFLWLYKEQLEACSSKTAFSAYLVGIENLLAVREACRMLDLTKQQVEDIFYNNAMELFGLKD